VAIETQEYCWLLESKATIAASTHHSLVWGCVFFGSEAKRERAHVVIFSADVVAEAAVGVGVVVTAGLALEVVDMP
jgi:hypothetical protein